MTTALYIFLSLAFAWGAVIVDATAIELVSEGLLDLELPLLVVGLIAATIGILFSWASIEWSRPWSSDPTVLRLVVLAAATVAVCTIWLVGAGDATLTLAILCGLVPWLFAEHQLVAA